MPKEVSKEIWLSVIMIDSFYKIGKNYYLQLFSEQCKYIAKDKKINKYIIDDL